MLGVVVVHLWLVDEVAQRLPSGDDAEASPDIKRMDVAFVRELQAQTPMPLAPLVVPVPAVPSRAVSVAAPSAASAPPRKPKRVAAAVASRASETAAPRVAPASTVDLQTPSPPPTLQADAADPAPAAQVLGVTVAEVERGAAETSAALLPSVPDTPGSANSASASADAKPFQWPPSTRLTYTLNGNYRGEIEGSARVQWLRNAERYQVHMDVAIGPSFAPIMARRMTSEGDLGVRGLVPRRYHEETRVGFSTRRNGLQMDDQRVVLANGTERPTLPGVQDSASQFVQMSFMFTLNPALLKAGASVTIPVALPRRVDNWIYDVVGEETLQTSVGSIKAFHVKPRRESPRQGELTAQAWFAPSLRYLPVRILIHQDAETFVDLLLDALPSLAEPER